MDYRFQSEAEQSRFDEFLECHRNRIELVAPHGHGKSTLLHAIVRRWQQNCCPVGLKVEQDKPRLPMFHRWLWRDAQAVWVDSGELLSSRQYRGLVRWVEQRDVRFVATRIAASGLLPAWRVNTPVEVAQAIAQDLSGNCMKSLHGAAEFSGDVRAFFDRLYQHWEERGDWR